VAKAVAVVDVNESVGGGLYGVHRDGRLVCPVNQLEVVDEVASFHSRTIRPTISHLHVEEK